MLSVTTTHTTTDTTISDGIESDENRCMKVCGLSFYVTNVYDIMFDSV